MVVFSKIINLVIGKNKKNNNHSFQGHFNSIEFHWKYCFYSTLHEWQLLSNHDKQTLLLLQGMSLRIVLWVNHTTEGKMRLQRSTIKQTRSCWNVCWGTRISKWIYLSLHAIITLVNATKTPRLGLLERDHHRILFCFLLHDCIYQWKNRWSW